MKRTFLNDNNEKNMEQKGGAYLDGVREDLQFYEVFSSCEDEIDFIETLKEQDYDVDETITACEKFKDLGSFYEYGLSFDFVGCGTFDDQTEAYYRYQFCWGGPSAELRIYEDGTLVFVYLDWFKGVGFDVSGDSIFEWVVNWFDDIGSIDWDSIPFEERYPEEAIEED